MVYSSEKQSITKPPDKDTPVKGFDGGFLCRNGFSDEPRTPSGTSAARLSRCDRHNMREIHFRDIPWSDVKEHFLGALKHAEQMWEKRNAGYAYSDRTAGLEDDEPAWRSPVCHSYREVLLSDGLRCLCGDPRLVRICCRIVKSAYKF